MKTKSLIYQLLFIKKAENRCEIWLKRIKRVIFTIKCTTKYLSAISESPLITGTSGRRFISPLEMDELSLVLEVCAKVFKNWKKPGA
ncbi:hypothetical protein J2TS6_48130 [Paenibacillus albilobatus]|uniref:Uncharacterized protein n=1 Tax=Paenibacillus albilobatus TaxID=2716884 RepID=A0A920CEE1_9BACL|nr:hypothetical protein J2TS6_48130 [Paenibacillus albilobatus]